MIFKNKVFGGSGTLKIPKKVELKFPVAEVSCGKSHMLVLSKEGNVYG